MERKEAIRGAYRMTGGNSFYDGMITCSTLSGKAVCRLVWAMNKAENDAYLEKVCPYVTVAILSCAHLSAEDRAREMQKAADHGVSIVLGTIGEDGSYVLYNGKTYYASAVHADDVIDTMGAGDSYFAAFLCSLLKSSKSGALLEGTEEENAAHLQEAMQVGAAFAAKMCAKEGAFGYGTPIVGRTEL